MCSVFGVMQFNHQDSDYMLKAADLLRYRGPDYESVREIDNLRLGHQRLKIIDLSSNANQPFQEGSNFLSFNGEIFNFDRLKRDGLADQAFSTSSDTEVLLKVLIAKGINGLRLCNGMFAFAWYNSKNKTLILARDRFGVKPLYFSLIAGNFYFASEVKPLIAKMKSLNFNNGYIESFISETKTDYDESTYIKGIYQIKPGHYLKINGDTFSGFSQKQWYTGNDSNLEFNFKNREETYRYFEDLLTDAINIRLISDVPIGLTLSGGLDSSAIYTLIRERLNRSISCFSVSHTGSPTDESKAVISLTKKYGDSLHLIHDQTHYNMETLRKVLYHLDFPIWDNSAITYYNTYKTIKESGITVVIEGHGSDEQLGGYPYMLEAAYRQNLKNWNLLSAFEVWSVLRKTLNPAFNEMPPNFIDDLWKITAKPFIKEKLLKIPSSKSNDFEEILQEAFHHKILPIVLRTFDRMTMANSVESRCPFMDYRLVEFMRKMPSNFKVNHLGSKAPLRWLLAKYQNHEISKNYKKTGFSSNSPSFFRDCVNQKLILDLLKTDSKLAPNLSIKTENLNLDKIRWSEIDPIWKSLSLRIVEKQYAELANN